MSLNMYHIGYKRRPGLGTIDLSTRNTALILDWLIHTVYDGYTKVSRVSSMSNSYDDNLTLVII